MRPSAPVLSSAVLACVHEGWAADEFEAETLIAKGQVRFVPAQHYGVVTPLAEVVTHSTPLTRVSDLDDESVVAWAPRPSGNGPQMRFGTRNPAVLDRHVWRDSVLAPALAGILDEPIDLLAPARASLAADEDLHSATSRATATLAAEIDRRLGQNHPHRVQICAMLAASPLFFLTFWMAACRTLLLGNAEAMPSLLIGLAGNGQDVGLLLGLDPMAWTVASGTPPEGTRLDPSGTAPVSPMIGDSGVIDIAGFGGQCARDAPASAWLEVHHGNLGARIGLDLRKVLSQGALPRVHIGMIGADGQAGLLGRGVYRPPAALFRAAMTEAIARTMPT
jgi:hypothetical protein